MPAFRNIGPPRGSINLEDRDQNYVEQSLNVEPSSTFVADSAISSRTIYTPRSDTRDSISSGLPGLKRPRLILYGPKRDDDGDQKASVTHFLATPHHPAPDFIPPNNRKRRRISASSHTSSSPAADLPEVTLPRGTPNESSIPVRAPRSRKKDKNYIPRPKNAFILFRSEFYQKFTEAVNEESLKTLDQANISQQAACKWRSLSGEEKELYMEWAAAEKKAHAAMYPDYSYSPEKRKPKSHRKTSKTPKRKAPNHDAGEIGLPSRTSLEPRLQPPPSPVHSPPSPNFSLHPASWGSQGDGEPGLKMNPITESSPYMNRSDENILEGSEAMEATREVTTTRQDTYHPPTTSPPNYLRGPPVSLSRIAPSTNNPESTSSSAPRTVVTAGVARVIRPPLSPNAEPVTIADTKPGYLLQGASVQLPSGRLNGQSANPSKAATFDGTNGGAVSTRHIEARVTGPLAVIEAELVHPTNLQLNMPQVTNTATTGVFSSHTIRQKPDNASSLGRVRGPTTPHFPMLEGTSTGSFTMSYDERVRRFATPRFQIMSKDPLSVSPSHGPKRSFVEETPPTVPPAMSPFERQHGFATSRFRIESEEPPTIPPMSPDERKRRFATSRFRVISEEPFPVPSTGTSSEPESSLMVGRPPIVPSTMSALERKRRFSPSRFRTEKKPPMTIASLSPEERRRRFATSRFCIMSEEPPPATNLASGTFPRYRGRFAKSRIHHIMKEPRLSLLQRTSKLLKSRIYLSSRPLFSSRCRQSDSECSRISPSDNLEPGPVLAPSPFPPLQFTAENIPEVFSVRILGFDFMASC